MSLDENEEDYWGSSKVKKKVNIFDDSVTVEAASDLAKFQKSLADDDDGIGFGDDPSSSIQSLSISQGQSLPSQTRTSRDTGFKTPSVSSIGKMSLAQSPSTPGYKMDSEPDLSTVLGSSEQRQTSRPALSRQEQEIEYLKQKLQQAENAIGTAKLKVEETIKRMIMGQPYALEQYKSKEEKLALLDKAIDTHDGNAIIASVVFMKRTLKDGIFNLELLRRPEAVDQYLAYLKAHYNLNEYSHMLDR